MRRGWKPWIRALTIASAIVLAVSTGKEISVPKKDIVERRTSDTSLMPENFGEVIPAQDFRDLMAFLLNHGPAGQK